MKLRDIFKTIAGDVVGSTPGLIRLVTRFDSDIRYHFSYQDGKVRHQADSGVSMRLGPHNPEGCRVNSAGRNPWNDRPGIGNRVSGFGNRITGGTPVLLWRGRVMQHQDALGTFASTRAVPAAKNDGVPS